jgi:hypothetical protein
MNDINVKGPKTTYNNKEIIFKIRRYILKHIIWIDRILADLKRVKYTILKTKSQFCMPKLRVIKFICDILKRHSNIFKVIKIVKWLSSNDITEIKAFIKVAVYYKMFVKNFAVIAAPIYSLIRKGIRFAWDTKQQLAINILKMAIITAPALVTLNYSPEAGEIILAVNSSLKRWGATLSQIIGKYRLYFAIDIQFCAYTFWIGCTIRRSSRSAIV